MHIECESCPVRDRHCADCMVTVLLGMPAPVASPVEDELRLVLDDRERRGVQTLFAAGLISESEARGARAVRERAEVYRVTG